jgi:hypothetical protein
MGLGVASQSFCAVCGSAHGELEICPGDLRATGAERPGWRVRVETPSGHQDIGVLLAPSYDRWRARIVTYPNVLWSAPGRRGTLKFVGNTLEQAEAQAIAFIERHLRAKRHPLPAAANPPRPARPAFVAARRKSACLPVRFSLDHVITRGTTVNVSAEGMFVGVASPVEGGQTLLLHLDMDGHTLPMRGLVMWNRGHAAPHHPAGMGIRLSQPGRIYQSFVAGLA